MPFAVVDADAFKPGDRVVMGNGEIGIVKQFLTSPTGFHSYRVEVTEGPRAGSVVGATAPLMQKRTAQLTVPVSVGGRMFACRVASTPRQHARGLQGAAPLSQDEGMLFRFAHPRAATFHMGGVTFPIDIMFVEQGRVARVVRDARPGSAERWSHLRTDAVVEVLAGEAPAVGSRVAAPALSEDPARYEIRFPSEIMDATADPASRWKERGTPDTADPNANQMSPSHYKEQLGYDTVVYHDDPNAPALRPSASRKRAQQVTDPVDLVMGMIKAMGQKTRPLDWHRDALNQELAYASVTPATIADWVSSFGLTGGEATDVLEAVTSAEGMQILGDGLVLAGLARIANVASTDAGHVLVLWTEYDNVANTI